MSYSPGTVHSNITSISFERKLELFISNIIVGIIQTNLANTEVATEVPVLINSKLIFPNNQMCS